MSIKLFFNMDDKFTELCLDEMKYYFEKVFQTNVEKVSRKEQADITLTLFSENRLETIDTIEVNLLEGKGNISANTKSSLLTAIYRFFEEFGVRYLKPGRKNEYLPSLSIDVFFDKKIKISEKATYKHRGVCIEGADSFENIKSFIDWLPKIGFNTFFIQFENPYSFLKRWYEHEFNPYIEAEPFSIEIAQEMSNLLDEEIQKRGLLHHRVGHGWTGEVLGYSSKYGWEAGLKLPEEKKPFVAELDGKRELYDTAPILTSLDFANPEVTEKMVELIVDYAKERKDVDYLHVWLSDAKNNICECEECRKEIPSDQYVKVLNRLDERLTEEKLDTKICFLLYHELLFAPEKETIHNPNRFTMMFAPISRTFEKSYADVDYEKGIPEAAEYKRNQIILPNSLEENLSCLFSWKKAFSGDSFVYDYPLGRAHYGDLGYMKISKTIYRDIEFLDKLELNGYISCQELRAGFPHNFPNYIMGKTLWNKDISYESLKEEYFSSMYGKDWEIVTKYLEKLSSYSSCDYFNAIGDRQDADLAVKYDICVNMAYNFIVEIETNLSLSTGTQKENWKQLSYHREYVMKMGRALQLLSKGSKSEAQVKWKDLLDFIRRSEPAIQESLDVYRVIEVAKNYAGFTL